MVIAYVRSDTGSFASIAIQKKMIEQFARMHKVECNEFYIDKIQLKRKSKNVSNIRALGYSRAYEKENYYPEFERMILQIIEGNVESILVDMENRLYTYSKQYNFFRSICDKNQVRIIEVAGMPPHEPESEMCPVAIYHFTNQSEKRPRIFMKDLDKIYQYVSRQERWDTPTVFLDYSLRKSEHLQYDRMIKAIDKFQVIVSMDFYHIEDKLGTFIKEAKWLIQEKGIELVSIKDGKLRFLEDEILNQNYKVAVYDRWADGAEKNLEIQVFETFVKYKTKWEIKNFYIEKEKIERDAEQVEMKRLLKEKDQYDLILVKSFNRFHWRTSMFFKIMRQLGLPVYSLAEGGIKIEMQNI